MNDLTWSTRSTTRGIARRWEDGSYSDIPFLVRTGFLPIAEKNHLDSSKLNKVIPGESIRPIPTWRERSL